MTRLLYILLLATLIFSFAYPTSAAGLVPCGGSGQQPCNICDLFVLLKTIINYIIYDITPLFATLLFLYAGFTMILAGAKPEMMASGRKIFYTTITGLVVVYGSFLITNFVILNFAPNSPVAQGWSKLQCTAPGSTIPTGPVATSTYNNTGGISDSAARIQLNSLGITTPLTPCIVTADGQIQRPPGGGACGSFQGVQQETIREIVQFKYDCKCAVAINDATGPGHSTGSGHYGGIKFDMVPNAKVDAYIKSNFTQLPNRTSDNAPYYQSPSGARYAHEGDHWDVVVNPNTVGQ
ncbi:MAG: hypothetical protein A3A33_05005 [Candidatus Yanofskybacteria bacterium RIFCSPLOWO2_01_FULL_49_25]|uniref:Peptidase M15A C-terminal domain-containing protein n=1 Tax=Candidatus Yanofskybacteria bacterium RIFCSPLOWO2_01_FULL_49_25 TaxID=1802701 RepID=A0A1F8GSX6_9BACT|nr:MAG: hypothetical protein A3A33_05005 [Candidatus Yanofskybacteria bacterium RIFCSPLOWO2_01_FULL_49_25]